MAQPIFPARLKLRGDLRSSEDADAAGNRDHQGDGKHLQTSRRHSEPRAPERFLAKIPKTFTHPSSGSGAERDRNFWYTRKSYGNPECKAVPDLLSHLQR